MLIYRRFVSFKFFTVTQVQLNNKSIKVAAIKIEIRQKKVFEVWISETSVLQIHTEIRENRFALLAL